ncbi:MAG: polymerase subunit epsilon [Clostridiales bacterium]|jgi:DNA polymerase-3 subunit epsilon|nr:polymerase subunit epsilon [Clostridiales bacterium]MDN5298846.1 polymerase subunit epsilon [Clostridiales bacterium]
MHFFVLDVETANREAASVCQIGIVEVKNGDIVNRWSILIDPEGPFEYHNVRVHGITQEHVSTAKTFPAHYDFLSSILTDQYVVQHTNFDQMAMDQSCSRYNLPMLPIKWLDSSRMARKLWPEHKDCGYGLKALSDIFGITFKHHDACEDATATAKIVLEALKLPDQTVEGIYHQQLCEPKTIRFENEKLTYTPNPEGPFFGKQICFTGTLQMPRKKAMATASKLGFKIVDHVTFYTTYLIVGKPRRNQKTHKVDRANQLIEKGAPIHILSELEFKTQILQFVTE